MRMPIRGELSRVYRPMLPGGGGGALHICALDGIFYEDMSGCLAIGKLELTCFGITKRLLRPLWDRVTYSSGYYCDMYCVTS